MPEIVLATLNAKYIHASFGLRYLMANLGELERRAELREFDINQRAADIVEHLLEGNPSIIGLGVYIWNAQLSAEVVQILKRVAPEIVIILGGPEVSFETEQQLICQQADYVITGEADLKFAEVCARILEGNPPAQKVIAAELPDLGTVRLPYHLYTEQDAAHRVIYLEASRGCPFTCEFCLSSLDVPVRQFPIAVLLRAIQELLDRGVRQFKFVDRTFNLNLATSSAILEFFLERVRPGLFLHFEMIPDRLPEGLRAIIQKFPPGMLQFEVGIQTFNPAVAGLISRRQNYDRLRGNLQFLRQQTGVHIHADLIAGLPGEEVASFARGFDQLVRLGPQEIQLGILKRLRGTPIVRHDREWEMRYNPAPPYEVLRTRLISFGEMQMLRRFSRHWDLVVNSGNFTEAAPLIWEELASPFQAFAGWSAWLHARAKRSHGIALGALAEFLFEYLTGERRLPHARVAAILLRDYQRSGRSDIPLFLREHVEAQPKLPGPRNLKSLPKRQARHQAAVQR